MQNTLGQKAKHYVDLVDT